MREPSRFSSSHVADAPTAIFCVNDVTVFGALDMARKMKIVS